ncbi:MAG: RseA family anti-sigma factor [Methylovulum sp.]|nr:RseA family anti-sigma factor [Methylovulum sp.]
MNKALNQKISQFLDDDLDAGDALDLLQKMQWDADAANTLNRYEAISHALKTNEFLAVSPDFAAKIAEQIQQEPFYLLPGRRPATVSRHKLLALAASVAVIAVLAMRGVNNQAGHTQQPSGLQVAQQPSVQPAKVAAYTRQPAQLQEQYPLNKRINDYLQAHNNSVYTNGGADFAPLTSVTAYRQK